ncbi:aminotransferase class V-fold PLP-dependent enzyme [Candidatus Peregrinibacteria bacterium]|nr:aminotransferase class V-fold PLP-dependent enzyme [Candidatus Peregrinibacteria bacterium]
MKKEIYLDHASTTYTDPRVLGAMLPYFSEKYGNPQSRHSKGKEALIAIDNAREKIAEILNCRPSEIIFTSGGTESNNLAIFGTARANQKKGKKIITSKIEHSSVIAPFKKLEKEKFKITYLDVDNEGFIDPRKLKKSIKHDTKLVSIMYANNEIGTIQKISKIGKICREKGIIFHTDACQAAGLNLNTQKLKVDLMSLNAGKIYGPKGIGILYKKREIKIEPIIYGGGQEMELRSGTHNVPAIVGIAKALEIAREEREKENNRLKELRNYLIEGILKIKDTHLNGPKANRLPNNINIYFEDIDADLLVLSLDEAGIYCSTASACKAQTTESSHVLSAIGLSENQAQSSIRFSLGKKTTQKDIDYTLKTLTQLIKKMRKY